MMEKSQNTALLYSLEDYIGAFRILDALPIPQFVPSMSSRLLTQKITCCQRLNLLSRSTNHHKIKTCMDCMLVQSQQ